MNQCISCLVWFDPRDDESKDYCCKAHEPTFRQKLELLEPDYDNDDLLPEGW